MPVISITLLPGYGQQTEQRVVQRAAQAVRSVIAASNAGTTAFVMHANTYQRDGKVFSVGGAARPDAAELVQTFLSHMQARALDAAAALLAPNFVMNFPGSKTMHQLDELVQWAKSRYQKTEKTYTFFDQCWGDVSTVVYCSGTLRGIWLDGSPFEGIRFIDRFVVVDGLIAQQDVWNDIAEVQKISTQ